MALLSIFMLIFLNTHIQSFLQWFSSVNSVWSNEKFCCYRNMIFLFILSLLSFGPFFLFEVFKVDLNNSKFYKLTFLLVHIVIVKITIRFPWIQILHFSSRQKCWSIYEWIIRNDRNYTRIFISLREIVLKF